MSLEAMVWAWRQTLPPNGKLVLVALADHAHDDGTEARPSVALIARKTGYGARQVQRILAELLNSGVVRVQRPATTTMPTVYALNMATSISLSRAEFPTRGCPPELRLQIITRDGHRCVICGGCGDEILGPDGNPWEVDRITPGGHYTEENTRLTCRGCNRGRGQGGRHNVAPGDVTDDAPPDDTGDVSDTTSVTPPGTTPVTPKPSLEPSLKGDARAQEVRPASSPAPPKETPKDTRSRLDRCTRHQHDVDAPPCGACADAKRGALAAEQARLRAAGLERSRAAHAAAQARTADIDHCQLCDDHGYRGTAICNHDPDAADRAARRAAEVRAALLAKAS